MCLSEWNSIQNIYTKGIKRLEELFVLLLPKNKDGPRRKTQGLIFLLALIFRSICGEDKQKPSVTLKIKPKMMMTIDFGLAFTLAPPFSNDKCYNTGQTKYLKRRYVRIYPVHRLLQSLTLNLNKIVKKCWDEMIMLWSWEIRL